MAGPIVKSHEFLHQIHHPYFLSKKEFGLALFLILNGLAKKIILLWYEGMWVEAGKSEVISSQSFIEGLMWPAAKTHASGAKQPGFGSWSHPPL